MTDDIRNALGTLAADVTPPPTLVTGGLARGRRLRLRRRVAAAAVAVAGVAAVAGGAALVAARPAAVELDPAGRPVVTGGNVEGYEYRLGVERIATGDVCLVASGPAVPPAQGSCWEPSISGHEQSLDVGRGYAVAIVGLHGEEAGVTFAGVPEYTVPSAERFGWRFATWLYRGPAAHPPRFTVLRATRCNGAVVGVGGYYPLRVPEGQSARRTPEDALRLALGGYGTLAAPGVRLPRGPYLRVDPTNRDLVSFVHYDGNGAPASSVEVVKVPGGWFPGTTNLCSEM
ncbi:MAG TPA: hypothetical protein VFQ85_04030 [Mycobacteriales bacterium]|nr:hypothetical protein [Mycobacteriales bacterium]